MYKVKKAALAGTGLAILTIANWGLGAGTASATSCSARERQLTYTGLCESQAAALLPKGNIGDAKMFGCEMKPNDANFGAGAILYWATSCKGNKAELEMRIKGTFAELYQVKSSQGGASQAQKAGEFYADVKNPEQLAPNTAQTWMAHFSGNAFSEAEIEKCKARKEPIFGPNAYVVDNQPVANEEYRSACGQYGMNSGEATYWLLGKDNAWFFYPSGQDAMKEVDLASITFIKPDGNGKWIKDTMPSSLMAPSMSIPDSYEVTNIAGVAGATETPYGEARDYLISAGFVNRAFKYCVAERDFDGTKLRVGFDGGQWQVAVPYKSKPDYYSSYEVDGVSRGMSGTSNGTWTFWWLGMPELDQLRNGSMLIMNVGRASLDFDLKGSAASITKIEECIQRKGKKRG
jgi:hypothetical protein